MRGVAEGGADEQQSGVGPGVRREGAQAGALPPQRVLPAKVSAKSIDGEYKSEEEE